MAKPGDVLTNFVTAPWYNKVTKAVGLDQSLGGSNFLRSNLTCKVYNHSSTPKKVWEAVSLGTPKLDYESDGENGPLEELAFNTKDLDANDPHNIAILQQPLEGEVDADADALLIGASWLRNLDLMTEASKTRIHIGPMDTLEFTNCGRVECLRQYTISSGTTTNAPGIGPGPSSITVPAAPLGPTQATSGQEYICLVLIGKMNGIQLRINGYDFQISHDCGITWETWASGEACPLSS